MSIKNKCDVIIIDQTLREGEQAAGVAFSYIDKLNILQLLDEANIQYAEIGMVGISTHEDKIIKRLYNNKKLKVKKIVSSLCREKYIEIIKDVSIKNWFLIIPTSKKFINAKFHLNITQYIIYIKKILEYIKKIKVSTPFIVLEDSTRAEDDICHSIIDLLKKYDCRTVFLSDTVGTIFPDKLKLLIGKFKKYNLKIGVHFHNDMGLALINSLTSVECGAKYVTATVNGMGERAGITNLIELSYLLRKRNNYSNINFKKLIKLSYEVEKITGLSMSSLSPLTGSNVFSHESGVHIHLLLEDSDSYCGVNPCELGRKHKILLGKHSGKHALLYYIKKNKLNPTRNIDEILEEIKMIAAHEMHKRSKKINAFKNKINQINYGINDNLLKKIIERK